MSNYETAFIECCNSNNQIFLFSKQGDILLYPSKSHQSILIGSQINDTSCLTVNNNNLGVNVPNPSEKFHLDGNAKIQGTVDFGENGSITTNKLYSGLFYNTLADDNKLIVNSLVSQKESYDIINKIPVYNIQEKPKLETIGCLTKDLRSLYPACVNNVNNIDMIDYSKLIPLIISSIQYIQRKIQ